MFFVFLRVFGFVVVVFVVFSVFFWGGCFFGCIFGFVWVLLVFCWFCRVFWVFFGVIKVQDLFLKIPLVFPIRNSGDHIPPPMVGRI